MCLHGAFGQPQALGNARVGETKRTGGEASRIRIRQDRAENGSLDEPDPQQGA